MRGVKTQAPSTSSASMPNRRFVSAGQSRFFSPGRPAGARRSARWPFRPRTGMDGGQPLAEPLVADQLPAEVADHRPGLDQVGETCLDGLRPLGGVPDHDQRPLEYRALLLDAAGVGDQQPACLARPRNVRWSAGGMGAAGRVPRSGRAAAAARCGGAAAAAPEAPAC